MWLPYPRRKARTLRGRAGPCGSRPATALNEEVVEVCHSSGHNGLGWEPKLAFRALAQVVTDDGRGPFSLPVQ
jgi:hypothetical protein